MTAKEAALEWSLMILYSVIPSKETSALMERLEKLTKCAEAKPEARESFAKAKAIYDSLDESKAQQIVIVNDPENLAKFQQFRDYLIAISEHISEYKYQATIEGWDKPREFKLLSDGSILFQLTVCGSDCRGCARRVRDARFAGSKSGVEMEIITASEGQKWVAFEGPKVGNLNEYIESTLGIKITQLSKG